MSRRNWFGSLFARPHRSAQCDRQSSHERQSRLAFEPLELRTLLTTLTVDIADVACGDAGDNLYCGIQEAVDAASEGDKIKVRWHLPPLRSQYRQLDDSRSPSALQPGCRWRLKRWR